MTEGFAHELVDKSKRAHTMRTLQYNKRYSQAPFYVPVNQASAERCPSAVGRIYAPVSQASAVRLRSR